MTMRGVKRSLCLCAIAGALWAQSDRGTITGTVAEQAGAVIASAMVEATNTATDVTYSGASSGTGNYTLAQLPAGTYNLSVVVPGFKKYLRPGIIVEVASIVRVDTTLEVGAATESVTVQAEAPLLKTESGEVSYNVATKTLDDLPILTLSGSANTQSNPSG